MKNVTLYSLTILTVLSLVSFLSPVQAQFTLSAEVRPRSEFRNGFKTPRTDKSDPAFFTEQRSRLNMNYGTDKYTFRLSMQDVRLWGEVPQIFKQENGNTFLNEAWGQYHLSKTFSIKAGRQALSYDNERYLGALEWAQQGRRHDALLFIYDKAESKTKFHAGFAFNTDDNVAEPAYLQTPGANFYSVAGNYKTMQYGWFNKGFEKGSVSLLALNMGNQVADTTVAYKQTLGVIPRFNLGKVDLAADVYYQTGKLGKNDVNALLAGANVTFKTKATPLTLGVEYISGKDDADKSTDVRDFNPDFGTNHAFNGFMDYFFVGPQNSTVGVTDIYLKTKFKVKKGSLIANAHNFMTGSTQLDAEGKELSKNMGVELDLVYAIGLAPDVMLNIGYSQLFGTETLTTIRPGNEKMNNWAWMQISFTPTLLKTTKQ